MDERHPDADERTPDAPTGDPERAQREVESREEPDTKYHEQRGAEEAERADLADDVADQPLTASDE